MYLNDKDEYRYRMALKYLWFSFFNTKNEKQVCNSEDSAKIHQCDLTSSIPTNDSTYFPMKRNSQR